MSNTTESQLESWVRRHSPPPQGDADHLPLFRPLLLYGSDLAGSIALEWLVQRAHRLGHDGPLITPGCRMDRLQSRSDFREMSALVSQTNLLVCAVGREDELCPEFFRLIHQTDHAPEPRPRAFVFLQIPDREGLFSGDSDRQLMRDMTEGKYLDFFSAQIRTKETTP